MRRDHEERMRQLKPFVDTPPTNALPTNSEEFRLHEIENKPKKRSRRRRRLVDINIPEMDLYRVKSDGILGFDYDFSKATTEELTDLYTFYSALYSDLDSVQQAFVFLINIELKERKQRQLEQPRGKAPPGDAS